MVSVWNLCDLIETLVLARPATSTVYMVSDGSDCTTLDLIAFLRKAINQRHFSFPVPLPLVALTMSAAGHDSTYEKLFGSLQVDIGDTETKLDWRPKHSTAEGIRLMIQALD